MVNPKHIRRKPATIYNSTATLINPALVQSCFRNRIKHPGCQYNDKKRRKSYRAFAQKKGEGEAGEARPTKGKRRASVKGGFYFVPGLENRFTNYQRIRWKVKQAPWCLLGGCCTRRKERKQEREGEREGEKETAITSCSTMSKDAIYFVCLMSSRRS